MIVPPALLSRGQSEPLAESNAFLCPLLETANMRVDGLALSDLVENDLHQDISFLARDLGKNSEDIMRLVVSSRIESTSGIPAAVFYAFLRQRTPTALPDPLIDASQGFTLIEALVQHIASLIFGLSTQIQEDVLTSAVTLGLVGPQYSSEIVRIVAELHTQRTADLLKQPYLVGKTTLGQLLDVAQLPEEKQQAFAHAL